MSRYIRTDKMRFYLVKLVLRIAAFSVMLTLYFRSRENFFQYTEAPVRSGVNFMHIMWLVFMIMMITHLFPTRVISMGAGKTLRSNYIPIEGYSEEGLKSFVREENRKARRVMLVWLAMNGIFALLFFMGVIGKPELLMLTAFYFISDYVCILFFCPFQTFGQKSRCCVSCRLYDWGHFLMFTPMLLMKNFYGLSLFFMGTAVILRWEIIFRLHPERFWEGSNKAIRCASCNDKTCTIKRDITGKVMKLLKK